MRSVISRLEELVKSHPDIDELKDIVVELERGSADDLLLGWINSIPLPMWVHDRHRIVIVNDAAIENYGYSREEFTQLNIYDLRPPEHRDRLTVHLGSERTDFNASRWVHMRKDGSAFDVEITSSRFPPVGEEARLILARDLTEQLKHERRMREFGAANTAGLVVAYMFHDVANYLMAGQTQLQLLRRRLQPEHQELADKAVTAYGEAQSILRAAIGKEERFAPKIVNVNELVERSTYVLNRILRPDYKIETDLRARQRACVDPLLFGRMTANLAKNASDATIGSGMLRIITEDDPTFVHLAFEDNGKGMTHEEQQRIFTPFYTTKTSGTGLGLSGVQEIVKLHSGRIAVSSEPGKGTRFDVYFPAA